MALKIVKKKANQVILFDMDQTKGLFRTRDHREMLENNGVRLGRTTDFFDSPVIPEGVTGALCDPDVVCVFDVGGNQIGARMLGQFAKYFNSENTQIFYVINLYRPFTETVEDIETDMNLIIHASGLRKKDVVLISNPCMGANTSLREITEAHLKLTKIAKEKQWKIAYLSVRDNMARQIPKTDETEILPIEIYIENRMEEYQNG